MVMHYRHIFLVIDNTLQIANIYQGSAPCPIDLKCKNIIVYMIFVKQQVKLLIKKVCLLGMH